MQYTFHGGSGTVCSAKHCSYTHPFSTWTIQCTPYKELPLATSKSRNGIDSSSPMIYTSQQLITPAPLLFAMDMATSIKLKINRRVGASLLELEFNWCSHILTEDTLVVIITDQLLKVCMTINVHIDLSVQFLQVPFFQRWTALKVRQYALFQW